MKQKFGDEQYERLKSKLEHGSHSGFFQSVDDFDDASLKTTPPPYIHTLRHLQEDDDSIEDGSGPSDDPLVSQEGAELDGDVTGNDGVVSGDADG